MPNGFVLPMYKITRVWDGLAALSTRQGGTAEIARFYGEQVDSFTSNLKARWYRHVDTREPSFDIEVFRSGMRTNASRRTVAYRIEPLLMQSSFPTSRYIPLSPAHLDTLTQYLRDTKTNATATTFSLSQCTSKRAPNTACYSPETIEVDLHSDVFRVTFTSKRSRSSSANAMVKERYYLSVATMDQKHTAAARTTVNLRPRVLVYWHSELEQRLVVARIQVCHLLIAVRNANHLKAILASPAMLKDRRGYTEIEHITRELYRTSPQDLALLSRQMQQRNVGPARTYLRDVEPAVAKAYRLSRQPIHLLTNTEYTNMERISILRQSKPALTSLQIGGPLAACIVTEWRDGQQRHVLLCEVTNSKHAQNRARRIKKQMVRSLGVLLATIVCGA